MRFDAITAALALTLLGAGAPPARAEFRLGLPVTCTIGTDCFVQQWPDMDAGPGASDPFCGMAAYDGHDGLDIRLRSMADVARGVAVVAPAAGTVKGVRDAMPDRLIGPTQAGRDSVKGVECGNGVVIDHGDGWETQVCHLRRGSVGVKTGDRVETGARLGEIGASGAAEFPHVHLSVRRNGEKIDPATGHAVGSGCSTGPAFAGTLFQPEAVAALEKGPTGVLGLGLAGAPVDYGRLVVDGAPPAPPAGGDAAIVWAWVTNLRKGDALAFRMVAPDGTPFFEGSSAPLERNQAVYSAFAGRKRPLLPGRWTVSVEVIRNGEAIASQRREVEVAG
ncbi:M23 family metallopeptidase [Aureimonas flava]|uniref:M23 family metallopeptidase n=1 Tax=Aureimonas flava TaxID=2320271 RepID=A0A3A1WQP7_9HYPH|nr:M23 family metallopeptidase [Aureimonas flava]RIY00098.1 M23 family metallopeptidase [Aureimonas flava]